MDNTWFEKMEERIPRGEVRTRFAPSPTGYMHVGNLRTALYTWCIARHAHGKFLLRIEDTDQSRQVEGAVEVIYKTLRDCGLDHDEGPDVGGPVGPYVQTERRDTYLPYAKRLVERGHAYYCFCDKTESEEDSGDFTRKDDPCRDLSAEEVQRRLDAGMPWVIRQKIPHEGETTFHDEIFGDITAPNADLDDQVLIKRDGLPTYNFANVIDDHLMGITHVVRGSEYLSSAPKYNLLYEAFGWTVLECDGHDLEALDFCISVADGAVGRRIVGEAAGDAYHFVACAHKQCGGYRAVHPAAHAQRNAPCAVLTRCHLPSFCIFFRRQYKGSDARAAQRFNYT